MLIKGIVRKTLGLKRHCVKEVRDEDGQLMVYLLPDSRCKLVCSSCGSKGPGKDFPRQGRDLRQAQGLQDASFQGQDHSRSGRHADELAAFRL